ncbi:MAG TPA: GTP cyclohydrolase [Flavobacteriaceae bacterium]|nr:GTP cyclohydrolase [Flavobacteriaceae bacterium]
MLEIKEVLSRRDLEKFVKFPFKLYKTCPYWVPPLIKDEINSLDPTLNPAFNDTDAWFYLAYRNGEVVGRIGVAINHIEIQQLGKRKVRFGWLDMVDDIQVTKALIGKAFEKGRELGLEYIEGPMGFNNMEKAGILTKGFKEMNTMITWYHYPYYFEHMKLMGFEKQATWVEYKMDVPPSIFDRISKFSNLVKERHQLKVIPISTKEEITELADEMFTLLNETYNRLQTYVPLQIEQREYYKKKYLNFLTPEYITCIKDAENKLVAFSIVMPSFSKALKKANGKLFPWGWKYILDAQRKNDTAAFYLIGIAPSYQGRGVTAIIFEEMLNMFIAKGIKTVETNPELIENKAVQSLWKDYNPVQHKERSTFRRNIMSGFSLEKLEK